MALARFTTLLVLSAGFIMSTGSAHAAATDWVGDSRAAVRLITATDNIAADSTLEAGLGISVCQGVARLLANPGRRRHPTNGRLVCFRKYLGRGQSPGPLHIVSSSMNCRTASTRTTWFFRSNYF